LEDAAFDRLSRAIMQKRERRGVVSLIAAALAAVGGANIGAGQASAKNRTKSRTSFATLWADKNNPPKRKKKKKAKPNQPAAPQCATNASNLATLCANYCFNTYSLVPLYQYGCTSACNSCVPYAQVCSPYTTTCIAAFDSVW
jgi:hypothetical protein